MLPGSGEAGGGQTAGNLPVASEPDPKGSWEPQKASVTRVSSKHSLATLRGWDLEGQADGGGPGACAEGLRWEWGGKGACRDILQGKLTGLEGRWDGGAARLPIRVTPRFLA